MWSSSFNSERGLCTDSHIVALYVDVTNDLAQRDMKEKLIRIMEANDKVDSVGGRGGIHIIFHLEIDIATDDDEVEKKVARLGAFRTEAERIYLHRFRQDIGVEEEKAAFDNEFSSKSLPLSAGAAALMSKRTQFIETFVNRRLFLTLSCNVIHPTIMNFVTQTGKDYAKPFDVFCLSYQDNREKTVAGIHQLYRDYGSGSGSGSGSGISSSSMSSSRDGGGGGGIKLGLGMEVPKEELLWILNHIAGEVSVYLMGYMSKIPNLNLRCMEIAHNKGLNTMVILREADIFQPPDRLDVYKSIYEAYTKETNDSIVIFFVKVLMQIGFIIGLDGNMNEDMLVSKLFSLQHPFVGRKVEICPSLKKRIFIAQEDIEKIKTESENIESDLEDRAILKKACGREKYRVLTYVAKKVVELDIQRDLERIAKERGISIEQARKEMESQASAAKARRMTSAATTK